MLKPRPGRISASRSIGVPPVAGAARFSVIAFWPPNVPALSLMEKASGLGAWEQEASPSVVAASQSRRDCIVDMVMVYLTSTTQQRCLVTGFC